MPQTLVHRSHPRQDPPRLFRHATRPRPAAQRRADTSAEYEIWHAREQGHLLDAARDALRIAGAWLELLRDARRAEASELIRECEREFESAWERKREAERTALVWFSLSEDDRHRRYLAERIGARGKR
jgi:hypothetical protein